MKDIYGRSINEPILQEDYKNFKKLLFIFVFYDGVQAILICAEPVNM